jgi:hypothetical protein
VNVYLKQRLDGLLDHFRAGFLAGLEGASANRGTEREAFLSAFLSQVLPPIYRVGTGEITDDNGKRSGQLDIIIEMPWAPSFGFPGSPVRLYPAEAVGVVIEVKSNVADQWTEVERTAASLGALRQRLSGHSVHGDTLRIHNESVEPIPIFVVGYRGWKSVAPVKSRLLTSELDGILILENPLFVDSDRLQAHRNKDSIEKHPSLAAHKSILDLHRLGDSAATIAAKLNAEGLNSVRVHLGDERYLPNVAPNAWTASDVEASIGVLARGTTSHAGTEALFAFVHRIHTELSKRSGMSVNLDLYASH